VSADLSGADLGRLMEETLRALRPGGGRGAPDTEEIRGEAAALDGLIAVVAGPGGRVESLTINPRALRNDSATLAAEVLGAVNAALDDLRDNVAAAVPAVPDRAALAERLREVQDTSMRRMETFLQAVSDAQTRITGSVRS
jgi:DNA-binding protein YbaB